MSNSAIGQPPVNAFRCADIAIGDRLYSVDEPETGLAEWIVIGVDGSGRCIVVLRDDRIDTTYSYYARWAHDQLHRTPEQAWLAAAESEEGYARDCLKDAGKIRQALESGSLESIRNGVAS